MARREPLHRLIDELRDEDLPAVTRVLQALRATGEPVLGAALLGRDETKESRGTE
jgi:hypothetical protein